MTTTLDAKMRRYAKQHAEKFPQGCASSWSLMCNDCRARLGALEPPSEGIVEWRKTEALTWRLDANVKAGCETLAKFRKSLDESPEYAMRWADDVFIAAAELHVATKMKAVLAHPEGGRAKALELAREEALRGARNPERSTSACHNLMAQAMTQAWAELVSGFNAEKD